MTAVRAVLAVARADARERMRRYSFLVTLAAAIHIGYLVNVGWLSLRLSGYRGVANSAWVGGQMAVIISSLLTLVGFYLVKGSVARDHETGVGEILAATRLSRLHYMLGKLLSNAGVLAAIVVILSVAAALMQLLAGETDRVDLVGLLAPMALIALPAMVATAALALLFEAIRPLRGGLGNVVFFLLWTFLLAVSITARGVWDLTGVSLLHGSMLEALHAQHPGAGAAFTIKIQPPAAAVTFVWNGLAWTPALIAARLVWLGLAGAATVLAAALFDRFDPARGGVRAAIRAALPAAATAAVAPPAAPPRGVAYTAIAPPLMRFSFASLWLAECRLLLSGHTRWWLLVASGLLAAQALAPAPAHLHPWLALAWIWPLLIWSSMGCRQRRDRVDQVLWSAPSPVLRQLAAEWGGGAALAAAVGGVAAVRLLLAGDARGLAALAAGALLISALALALGTLTGGSKTFEAVWLVTWYVGLLQKAPFLDLAGTTPASVGRTAPAAVALVASALAGAAAAARCRRLRA